MRTYAKSWPERVWAVEGSSGAGRPLVQRLLEAGEHVVDVPAKLAARLDRDQVGELLGRDPPMEAMRCLKRRLSDVVYRQLLTDAQRAALEASPDEAGTGRLRLEPEQMSSAVDVLERLLVDRIRIVQVKALDGLVAFADMHGEFAERAAVAMDRAARSPHTSVRARARG